MMVSVLLSRKFPLFRLCCRSQNMRGRGRAAAIAKGRGRANKTARGAHHKTTNSRAAPSSSAAAAAPEEDEQYSAKEMRALGVYDDCSAPQLRARLRDLATQLADEGGDADEDLRGEYELVEETLAAHDDKELDDAACAAKGAAAADAPIPMLRLEDAETRAAKAEWQITQLLHENSVLAMRAEHTQSGGKARGGALKATAATATAGAAAAAAAAGVRPSAKARVGALRKQNGELRQRLVNLERGALLSERHPAAVATTLAAAAAAARSAKEARLQRRERERAAAKDVDALSAPMQARGWLLVRGKSGKGRGWRRMFCVLRHGSMYAFDGHAEAAAATSSGALAAPPAEAAAARAAAHVAALSPGAVLEAGLGAPDCHKVLLEERCRIVREREAPDASGGSPKLYGLGNAGRYSTTPGLHQENETWGAFDALPSHATGLGLSLVTAEATLAVAAETEGELRRWQRALAGHVAAMGPRERLGKCGALRLREVGGVEGAAGAFGAWVRLHAAVDPVGGTLLTFAGAEMGGADFGKAASAKEGGSPIPRFELSRDTVLGTSVSEGLVAGRGAGDERLCLSLTAPPAAADASGDPAATAAAAAAPRVLLLGCAGKDEKKEWGRKLAMVIAGLPTREEVRGLEREGEAMEVSHDGALALRKAREAAREAQAQAERAASSSGVDSWGVFDGDGSGNIIGANTMFGGGAGGGGGGGGGAGEDETKAGGAGGARDADAQAEARDAAAAFATALAKVNYELDPSRARRGWVRIRRFEANGSNSSSSSSSSSGSGGSDGGWERCYVLLRVAERQVRPLARE